MARAIDRLGIRNAMKAFAQGTIELVYPPRCALCGIRGVWVCERCAESSFAFVDPICERCGVPSAWTCACASLPESIDWVRSSGAHLGWLRASVLAFKYGDEPVRAQHLAHFVSLALPRARLQIPDDALLVPVPLHRKRLRTRGYNQAGLLAAQLAGYWELAVLEPLVRVRQTDQQARLGMEERKGNMKDAFAMAEGVDVRGRVVVLIDDVFTTGATLGACADALKAAGASTVCAVTITHGT